MKFVKITEIVLLCIFLLTFYSDGAVFGKMILAQELDLPPEVKAEAKIQSSTWKGFKEKTLVITFPEEREALSTFEGFGSVLAVVNYSLEPEGWKKVCAEKKKGKKSGGVYHLMDIKERLAQEIGIPIDKIFILGTAANMDYLAKVVKKYGNMTVIALVTAGAKSNALRAGYDNGSYIEDEEPQGTVNIILLTNKKLSSSAMARAIITITEAKTAAFEDLRVASSYSPKLQATGTGTDNIIIISGNEGQPLNYTGGHSKIGELIAKAVYEAVKKALITSKGYNKIP